MSVRKVIRKAVRTGGGTHHVDADVHAAVAVNVGESKRTTTTSVKTRKRIVQRSDRERGAAE